MSQTTTSPAPTTRRAPSAAAVVGGAIGLSTGVQLAVFGIGMVVASDHEINRDEGIKDSLVSVSVVAAVALAVGFGIALATHRSSSRSRIGAIVLGALSVLSVPVFWAGAPAVFGSLAAWLGGLTRNGRPHTGAARAFGVIGLVVAVLNVLAILVLTLGSVLIDGFSD